MTASEPRVPLLLPRPPLPGGRWWLGVAIAATLVTLFWLAGIFDPATRHQVDSSYGAALFFSAVIGYMVPVLGYISDRTEAALAELAPALNATVERQQDWRRRIRYKPLAWHLWVLAIGAGAGLAHNLLLFGSPADLWSQASGSSAVTAVVLGTELTWLVLTVAIAALLDNAFVLARAAGTSRVELFQTARLRPFATIAVISTLGLIGAQAAFPIMFLGGELDAAAFIPGLIATGVPMLLLAALPVWPVHRRIAAAKAEQLARLNRRLLTLPAPDPERPDTLTQLTPLLAYRRELLNVSEWPFDVGVLTRLGLYLIIPPLTWVGAALIENLVEALL